MLNIQVIINGRDAKHSADLLLRDSQGAGKLVQIANGENGTRSMDFSAIVEFFEVAKPIVGTLGGSVSLAYTIWKWRQDLKKKEDVTISKGKNGKKEEMEIYLETTREEIEDFLELKPLDGAKDSRK